MLGFTENELAFVVLQVKVTRLPAVTVVGFAVNVTVGGAEFTVIVTWAVAVPPAPVAVAT
jgi:hypothetical protein